MMQNDLQTSMNKPAEQSLMGKHALVTGGGSGIGLAIARALLKQGVKVTITGRTESRLQDALQQLENETAASGVRATVMAVAMDVSDAGSVRQGFTQARTSMGEIDILINNAGQAGSAPFLKTSVEHWQEMLSVNLTGCFLCSQEALPAMMKSGWGRIINVASTAALKGYAYVAAYCAAKHGVLGLTRALAVEVAQKGVTVNAVCPGFTETDIVQEAIRNIVEKTGRSEAEARTELASANPQKRLIQPQEVADTVLWLCQPSSASQNGQAIAIAGGEVM